VFSSPNGAAIRRRAWWCRWERAKMWLRDLPTLIAPVRDRRRVQKLHVFNCVHHLRTIFAAPNVGQGGSNRRVQKRHVLHCVERREIRFAAEPVRPDVGWNTAIVHGWSRRKRFLRCKKGGRDVHLAVPSPYRNGKVSDLVNSDRLKVSEQVSDEWL
jgi:hypothetical protein